MKVLVVGGGGREHAVIKKLRENPEITEIFALPGNGGIARDAACVPIGAKDIASIVSFAEDNAIDYAVVTPDDPLVLGCVDALEAIGVPCFGPRADAALIEGSKVFAKELMKKYGIPTARYESFDDMEAALRYLESAPLPTVIKADGLALGKGVIIAQTREEARAAVVEMMQNRKFGKSGEQIVIEVPKSPSWPLPTGRRSSPWSLRWTTSAPGTMTRVSTPAAWAPSRPTPITPRRSPHAACRRSFCPPWPP